MGEDENVVVQNMSLSGELSDRYSFCCCVTKRVTRSRQTPCFGKLIGEKTCCSVECNYHFSCNLEIRMSESMLSSRTIDSILTVSMIRGDEKGDGSDEDDEVVLRRAKVSADNSPTEPSGSGTRF